MSISKSCHLPFVLTLLVIFWTCQSSDSNVTSTASEDPGTFPSELYPLLITDDSRTIHQFISAPKRIISLVPSATETLLSMDLGNNLVGRTEFDIATPEIRNLPSVGLGMNPDLEILLSLNPDLVIGFSGESDTSITRHLKNSNITYFMIRPDKLEDAVEIIKRLSLITDRKSLGDSIILNINTSLEIVQQKIANKVRPRIAYVLGGEPPWVAGPGTYIHQLIIAGGGQNIFDDLEHKYAPVSLEEFFVRKLDLILLTENTRLPNALKHLRTFTISSSVEIPGPGLGEAVFEIAHGIHPQVFP
jgi:iron complex transport system substrate-binding protein